MSIRVARGSPADLLGRRWHGAASAGRNSACRRRRRDKVSLVGPLPKDPRLHAATVSPSLAPQSPAVVQFGASCLVPSTTQVSTQNWVYSLALQTAARQRDGVCKHAYMNTQTMYHRCDHTCLRILVDAPSQMTKLFQFPHEDSNGAPPGSPLTLLPMDRLTVLFDILPAPNRIDWLCLQHTAQQTTFCASHAAPLAHPMDESPDG